VKGERFLIMCAPALLCACAPASLRYEAGEYIYHNRRYDYEIRYPDGFDLWATGPEGRRDGRSIRIALKDHAAPTPVLDIQVYPRAPAPSPPPGYQLVDLTVAVAEVVVAGRSGEQVEYRWKESGDLAFFEVYLDGVYFTFQAGPGVRDIRDTAWWKIISSFRLPGE
jgi:hypothetical protein